MSAVSLAPLSGATNAQGLFANPAQPLPTAAKILSTKLAKLDLDAIAEVIGNKDNSTACKVRSNERPCTVSQFCALLELAGLKLVTKEKQCISADELGMLRRCYARLHSIDLWEDPE
jgi:hypothetical protein